MDGFEEGFKRSLKAFYSKPCNYNNNSLEVTLNVQTRILENTVHWRNSLITLYCKSKAIKATVCKIFAL